MDWFKKHADTIVVLTGILSSVLWMNAKFNAVDKRFNELDKRLVVIETVLIMKGIMPIDLTTNKE